MSINTVRAHVRRIYETLQVQSRAEAVAKLGGPRRPSADDRGALNLRSTGSPKARTCYPSPAIGGRHI
ncbi:MAG: hypothetical protein AB7P34_05725 [Vicinamibacterales bacterium]